MLHQHEHHQHCCESEIKEESHRGDLIIIGFGIVFLIFLEVFHIVFKEDLNQPWIIALIVLCYLAVGKDVLIEAVKLIFKGDIFNENFLMSISTVGALIIGEYPEAIGVMIFFKIGEFIEDLAVDRSRKQIIDTVNLRPEKVDRKIENGVELIDIESAQIGDILIIKPGERIPIDGMIIKGQTNIDMSAITGESVPIVCKTGDQVYSGGLNELSPIEMRVEAVAADSMVTKIIDSIENAAENKPKIENFVTQFARVYTPIVIALALIVGIGIPLISGQDYDSWIYTALCFLVMSCPCALVLSVPLAYFCGIGSGSKFGILFKSGNILEVLAKIKAACFDKTGTLTEGKFKVREIVAVAGKTKEDIILTAARCEVNSTHPIAKSIVNAAKAELLSVESAESVMEIAGKGIKAMINENQILCGNEKLMSEHHIDLSEYQPPTMGTPVIIAEAGQYIGHIVIADAVRSDASSVIEQLKKQKIMPLMMTGDVMDNAESIGKAIGIEHIFAKLLPQEKASKMDEIRKDYGAVLFVGDGINDTPVLAGADVGIAMGSGADIAVESADIVVMNNRLASVLQSIGIAKRTVRIAKQNVVFALAVKLIVMLLGLTGIFANMWLAVIADTGVSLLCILNALRLMRRKG